MKSSSFTAARLYLSLQNGTPERKPRTRRNGRILWTICTTVSCGANDGISGSPRSFFFSSSSSVLPGASRRGGAKRRRNRYAFASWTSSTIAESYACVSARNFRIRSSAESRSRADVQSALFVAPPDGGSALRLWHGEDELTLRADED